MCFVFDIRKKCIPDLIGIDGIIQKNLNDAFYTLMFEIVVEHFTLTAWVIMV